MFGGNYFGSIYFGQNYSSFFIEKPIWVTPPNHESSVGAFTPLVFIIPTTVVPAHFEIQVDTANTFDSGNLESYKSWEDQTGWEYYNGSSWVAFPVSGVPAAYVGYQARYTPQTRLNSTLWYRRVRGRFTG